jgi:protoporphyrin/coproporphyrin ferrochelatase
VLLVNLGTPDTSDARGVRVYLKEFLSDPRVIENQGLIWKVILNGIILRVRPGRKARDYQKIWNKEKDESPLKTITRSQAEKLAAAIADHKHVVVDWAMRYGNRRDFGDRLRRGVSRARRHARATDAAGQPALL